MNNYNVLKCQEDKEEMKDRRELYEKADDLEREKKEKEFEEGSILNMDLDSKDTKSESDMISIDFTCQTVNDQSYMISNDNSPEIREKSDDSSQLHTIDRFEAKYLDVPSNVCDNDEVKENITQNARVKRKKGPKVNTSKSS